jgi:hypothetical protein
MYPLHASIALVFALVFAATGCTKDDPTPLPSGEAEERIDLAIKHPIADRAYAYGDTVKIHVEARSGDELHGYSVRLVNLSENLLVVDHSAHAHGHEFIISDVWVNTVADTCSMALHVEIASDHGLGDMRSETVFFRCYPE